MSTDGTVGGLMMFTLVTVLVIAVVAFLWFQLKRSNRHPMEGIRERNIDEIEAGVPPRRE